MVANIPLSHGVALRQRHVRNRLAGPVGIFHGQIDGSDLGAVPVHQCHRMTIRDEIRHRMHRFMQHGKLLFRRGAQGIAAD